MSNMTSPTWLIANHLDIDAVWAPGSSQVETALIDGGHVFIDENPSATARLIADFLGRIHTS